MKDHPLRFATNSYQTIKQSSGEAIRRVSLGICLVASWLTASGCVSPHPPPKLPTAPVCEPRPFTIWQFLGLEKCVQHIGDKTEHVTALAEHHIPGLKPVSPLKSLVHPDLAHSPSDSVRLASQVAKKKAQVPQIKAALASVAESGCACDPAAEQALLAGLENCFPEVRKAAAEAVRDSVEHGENFCDAKTCCSPAIRKRLLKIGWGRLPNGCPLEPVGEVRLAARQAYRACGCPLPDASSLAPAIPPMSAERPTPEIIQEAMAE
ncbi:hypothetical protein [Thalassoroseus pseudoceratinae]|uniref:hypothetical protein n=1 Tax=Thalassoroseus pseudoceratinae TaxID=2713176 RepID=UPI0014244FA6|nr:hypothetical protein [Thalassoroseus pseudoceratinae]